MITAYGDVDLAVDAIRKGAMDFVMKPWKNEKLLASILSAFKLRQSNEKVDKLLKTQQKLAGDINRNVPHLPCNAFMN